MIRTDVVVVGGGQIGAGIAFYLAREGVDVVVIERGEIGREGSGTNAGSLHFQVLYRDEYSDDWVQGMKENVRLHAEAFRKWSTLEEELSVDLELEIVGGLMVAETSQQMRSLELKSEVEGSMGIETVVLTAGEVRELVPEISPAILGANFCQSEGHGNPLLVAPAYAQRLEELGGRVRVREEVTEIIRNVNGGFTVTASGGSIEAKYVVNAAGAHAGKVAAMVGVHLPIEMAIMQVSVTERMPQRLKPLIQHVGKKITLKQSNQGSYLIGGGWPGTLSPGGSNFDPTDASTSGNAAVAIGILPHLRDVRVLRTWAGPIGLTPDWSALIGEYPGARGVFGAHVVPGYTLGPAVSELLARRIVDGDFPIDMSPFAFSEG